MIRVSISEMKNRLSHYLRLVKGGEELEILDRDTPVARVTHISLPQGGTEKSAWVKEMEKLGIIHPPEKKGTLPPELLSPHDLPTMRKRGRSVLDALLQEREAGR